MVELRPVTLSPSIGKEAGEKSSVDVRDTSITSDGQVQIFSISKGRQWHLSNLWKCFGSALTVK